MQKLNIPKTILITTLFISFALITGLSVFGFSEIKKTRDLPVDFIEPVKPVEDNNNQEPVEPTESVELETYEAELFVEAKWGSEEGEVGIFVSGGDAGGAGPVYGPQSFDVDDKTGYLYLLDSVNERVLEYDGNGKYLRDFPIACGGTGDIRISPDGEFLYVFSWRCEAIYKYKISGEFLEEYKVLPNEKKRPTLSLGGLSFDGSENVMLELEIESYFKGDKFYQIGKSGDEWKNNSYIGYQLSNKDEYCSVGNLKKGETWKKRYLPVFNKEGELKREIKIELLRDGFMYFKGLDEDNNIYLEIQYSEGSGDVEIQKHNQEGSLLAVIDIKEMPRINNFIYNYTQMFKKREVSKSGDVYLMFSNVEEIKIYKYSQVK